MGDESKQVIRILGKRFTFEEIRPGALGIENDGICAKNSGEIVINADMNADRRGEVILHECLHEIDSAMFCGLDESQVHRIAAGLWCLFADNKEFFTKTLGYDKPTE